MTPLSALWMPILLGAVLIFVASSAIHMASPWHKTDFQRLAAEDEVMDALRPLAIPPGEYLMPRAKTGAEMRSPDHMEKMKKGPVMMMTVMANGVSPMGPMLVQWFLYLLVLGFFAAYVAGRALAPGAHYLDVFRFVGVTIFLGYGAGLWPISIWYRRSWSMTFKSTFDGLIYAGLMAGSFGWLWPKS